MTKVKVHSTPQCIIQYHITLHCVKLLRTIAIKTTILQRVHKCTIKFGKYNAKRNEINQRMDRGSGGNDSVTTFTNQGFRGDRNMGESRNARMEQPLNLSGLRNNGNGFPASGSAQDRPNDQNLMPISECLRQFALEGYPSLGPRPSEHQHSQNIEQPKPNKYQNSCIIFLTIVVMLAPIGISTYVFLKHDLIISSPCSTRSVGKYKIAQPCVT